jgi:hypothetical protein
METSKNKWQDKRAIVVVRQSSDKDGTGSTEAQLDYRVKDLKRAGMVCVDKVVLEGVTGASPARITQVIEALFVRKKDEKDFEVIAWQVEAEGVANLGCGSSTRRSATACSSILRVMRQRTFRMPPSCGSPSTKRPRNCRSATAGALRKGRNGRRTKGFSGRRVKPPSAANASIRPKFVIRNLPSGLQEQRDWISGKIIGTYRSVGKKSRNRFKKQRNEYSLLVPGDRQQRKVVRVIFYLRYKRGWRGVRIADYLNRHGIPSPRGKEWSQRQAQLIYENEAYTGVTYNDQTYSGRFFRRDAVMGFVALDRDACDAAAISSRKLPSLRWTGPSSQYDSVGRANGTTNAAGVTTLMDQPSPRIV